MVTRRSRLSCQALPGGGHARAAGLLTDVDLKAIEDFRALLAIRPADVDEDQADEQTPAELEDDNE
ncbi:hypothetical protein AB0M47_21000 [Hamadaea sp. NPDC051192]|uniref:hypothetical protein n=1 Tax=Hamadaea sp. NPDC051192 TaxID=3154940 RepID=UPI00343D085A